MESIWKKTAEIPRRDPLPGDCAADVAVIGAGMAGVLTARRLQERGFSVVVLEAGRIASGQTRNTTAKITAQHGLIYGKLIDRFGRETAKKYARANEAAIAAYRELIQREEIPCDLTERPAYLYAVHGAEPVRREAEAARAIGIDASFTTETELPFAVCGAVRFEGQAQFHPLRFLRRAAEGLRVYEETRLLSAEGNRLLTNRGEVTARYVVVATHYPFPRLRGAYFMRMHQERSYVLALENAQPVEGMYLGTEEDESWSLRSAGGTLLFGGAGHRTGENRAGGRYETLRRKAESLWPGCRETARWSAQDCMTLDGMPYIGRLSSSKPAWYVATGFGKWGMTSSMVAAMLIADALEGKENPWADIFSPQRFTPGASAESFLADGMHAVRDLSRQAFAPPRAVLDALPRGHGGVVEFDGKKAGVYKDERGEVWAVSTCCPHLGCQLEWNPDEKSWDCPCHGSRFDYRGRLIDDPAQSDVARLSGE